MILGLEAKESSSPQFKTSSWDKILICTTGAQGEDRILVGGSKVWAVQRVDEHFPAQAAFDG